MLKAFLISVIATLTIAVIVLSISGPPYQNYQPPGEDGSKKPHTQKNEAYFPSSVHIECDPNCSNKNPEEQRNQSRLARLIDKAIDDPVALATFALSVVTLLLVGVVTYQVRDARYSSERQLRAYLSAHPSKDIQITGIIPTGDMRIQLGVTNRNHGATPARKCKQRIVAEVHPFPLPDNVIFPAGDDAVTSQMSIFPGQKFTTEIDEAININKEDVIKIISGEPYRIYIFSVTSYEDVFGESHETGICFFFGGKSFGEELQRGDGAPITVRWSPKHNYDT